MRASRVIVGTLAACLVYASPSSAQRVWRAGITTGVGPASGMGSIYDGTSRQLGASLWLAFDSTERWGLRIDLLDQRTRRTGYPGYLSVRGHEPGLLLHVARTFRPGSDWRPSLLLGTGTMFSDGEGRPEYHVAWSAAAGVTYTRWRVQPTVEWRHFTIADGQGVTYRPLLFSLRF